MNNSLGILAACFAALLWPAAAAWSHAALQRFTVESSSSNVFTDFSLNSSSDAIGHTTWSAIPNLGLLVSLPPTVVLNFPDRAPVTLSRIRSSQYDSNSFLWTGRGGDCMALFSQAPVGFRAVISCSNGYYGGEITSGGLQLVRTIQTSSSIPQWEPTPPSYAGLVPSSRPAGGQAAASDTSVEVLVLYNETVRVALGGTAAAIKFARDCVASAQMAMDASVPRGTPALTEVSFVGAAEVTRPDSGDIQSDLTYMTTQLEPANDRDFWKADVVMYLIANGGSTFIGLSNEPGFNLPLPAMFAPYAEGVVVYTRAMNDTSLQSPPEPWTFVHEFGHIFGANHNVESNLDPTPLTAYAFGHWSPSVGGAAGERTAMSYLLSSCAMPCVRIPNYSNPNVTTDDGFKTGLTNTAYNAKVIQDDAPYTMTYNASLGRIFVNGFQQYNQQ